MYSNVFLSFIFSPPPMLPVSIPPPPPPSTHLRLATFNLGLGFIRKLPRILDRCLALSLDVIALQEMGDPALTRTTHAQYQLIASPGPSCHEAGVGLLISCELAPRCRLYRRSISGRLVGVVLELSKGHRLLIVSAYMPTGLDHRAVDHAAQVTARKLYEEFLSWTRDVQQVILMGDLNETLTVDDRLPRPAALHHAGTVAARPIQCLVQEGFIDMYRMLHPDAARSPGFTHSIDSPTRSVRSRIDYIWTRGSCADAAHTSMHIDRALSALSHHHLIRMSIQLPGQPPPACARELYRMQLPNMRAASSDQKQRFIDHLEMQTHHHDHVLHTLASTLSVDSLSSLASELTRLVHRSAYAKLPITGFQPHSTRSILALQRQRRDLNRLRCLTRKLIRLGMQLTHSPEWTRLYAHCIKQHHITWHTAAQYNTAAWMQETQQIICHTRSRVEKEKLRLTNARSQPFDTNPASQVHRMLLSDALPTQLLSVIDDKDELTSNAQELENVMVKHFESVFTIPDPDPTPLHPPPPDMLFLKEGIDSLWYEELMEEVCESELLRLVADAPLVSAPGQDEVSTGVWKEAILHSPAVRTHVLALFSACMLTAIFPSAWKTSVIIPFIKDATKDRNMSNIRPISLQSCLGKLLSKLLAHRLAAILQRHPILNPAQRGFILGGTTMKCIDEVLDAWDWSRSGGGRELYTIFYDIKQAYDSVQTSVLKQAMRRLRLPACFINLIVDSLTNLSSCIRTAYGLTRRFSVHRSLRQGDPLAPLLFIILMDGLHDGL